MFQLLRLNSQVYIFYKCNNPHVETGYITNFPVPKPKYNIPFANGLTLEMVIDLQIKSGDLVLNLNSLPANAEIADSFSNGENVVVSSNKNAINAEILAFKLKSLDIIKSQDVHLNIVEKCDLIYSDFNPEYAERQSQKDEITNLKTLVTEISKSLTTLTELMTQLTNKEKLYAQNVGNKREGSL